MSTLVGWKRRTAMAVCETTFPIPLGGGEDRVEALDRMLARAPRRVRMGIVLALGLAALAPLLFLGRWSTLSGARRNLRKAALGRALVSSSYVVRQLVLLLKTMVAVVHFRSEARRRAITRPIVPIPFESGVRGTLAEVAQSEDDVSGPLGEEQSVA